MVIFTSNLLGGMAPWEGRHVWQLPGQNHERFDKRTFKLEILHGYEKVPWNLEKVTRIREVANDE